MSEIQEIIKVVSTVFIILLMIVVSSTMANGKTENYIVPITFNVVYTLALISIWT